MRVRDDAHRPAGGPAGKIALETTVTDETAGLRHGWRSGGKTNEGGQRNPFLRIHGNLAAAASCCSGGGYAVVSGRESRDNCLQAGVGHKESLPDTAGASECRASTFPSRGR